MACRQGEKSVRKVAKKIRKFPMAQHYKTSTEIAQLWLYVLI